MYKQSNLHSDCKHKHIKSKRPEEFVHTMWGSGGVQVICHLSSVHWLCRDLIIWLCWFQMLKLWRRDVPLSERLGEDSPMASAPGPLPTAARTGPNISWLPEAPLLSTDQPIFLMSPAAQAVSGFFVWTALILTCHQVMTLIFPFHFQLSLHHSTNTCITCTLSCINNLTNIYIPKSLKLASMRCPEGWRSHIWQP